MMSDREVNGKQKEGRSGLLARATAFPFPGSLSLSLSTSAMRTRLEDEDSLKATTAGTVIYFWLKSFQDIWNTSLFCISEETTLPNMYCGYGGTP